jgi:hypothetical protein
MANARRSTKAKTAKKSRSTAKKAKRSKSRTGAKDAGSSKSNYLRDENPALRPVVGGLRELVTRCVPDMRETVNAWGVPTFEHTDPFSFYMIGKNHVTFGFHFGTSLSDPEGLLEGTGKNIRHVKLRSTTDLERKGLKELVDEAARFEGKGPMRGMRGKKGPA